ncbi:MAG: calcium/sodium antiporter [Candidatus Omnitrophica bacterium]|nr:calcium/sodium antiporter [Candidatus Omnitrophota bacterium]
MDILLAGVLFLAGLLVLMFSADWLIQSGVKFAFLLRLSPLFIGLVLVAFGTSCPEAGVGVMAAIRDQKGIALGNVIGSNVANIGLILGLCSIFYPLPVQRSMWRREVPVMLASVVLLYGLSIDGMISRLDGCLLLAVFVLFLILSLRSSRSHSLEDELREFRLKKIFDSIRSRTAAGVVMVISIAGVVLGADLMVRGGTTLAELFGVRPWVIGITVFAVGTSLPELGASLAASVRKVPGIGLGNVVGSNIFNILFVLGLVALIRPIPVPRTLLGFEYPMLIVFTLVLALFMRSHYRITRMEGVVFLAGYAAFLFWVVRHGG